MVIFFQHRTEQCLKIRVNLSQYRQKFEMAGGEKRTMVFLEDLFLGFVLPQDSIQMKIAKGEIPVQLLKSGITYRMRSIVIDKTIKTLSFIHGSSNLSQFLVSPSTIQEQAIKALLLLHQTFILSASEQLKANSVHLKAAQGNVFKVTQQFKV